MDLSERRLAAVRYRLLVEAITDYAIYIPMAYSRAGTPARGASGAMYATNSPGTLECDSVQPIASRLIRGVWRSLLARKLSVSTARRRLKPLDPNGVADPGDHIVTPIDPFLTGASVGDRARGKLPWKLTWWRRQKGRRVAPGADPRYCPPNNLSLDALSRAQKCQSAFRGRRRPAGCYQSPAINI